MNKEYYIEQIKKCNRKITELQTRVLRFQSYLDNEHFPNKRGKKNKSEIDVNKNEIDLNKNELNNQKETGFFGI